MFDITSLETCREGNRLEAKAAHGGLPQSLWETYSAFANTEGGVILLGAAEEPDGSLKAVGVPSPERMVKLFWDAANNKSKVSANVLTNSDVSVEHVDGKTVIIIRVPRAGSDAKPVYVGNNPLTGTYRRNGEGDYHCSADEYRAMVRDSGDAAQDRSPLADVPAGAICSETVERYRNALKAVRPGHPWADLSDEDLLLRLGGMARSQEDGLLHPTRAGLLMFGHEWQIVREFPHYFLDYREVFGDRRWDDRIVSSDGEWTGNVFDFWRRVSPRLAEGARRPFALEGGLYRVDDTPLHAALREALANTLLHADYYGTIGSTIVRSGERIDFTNPGALRIPPEVVKQGGISSPRNPGLATMFNLIAVGEKAGSGFDAMRRGCDYAGLPHPRLAERFAPDRTELTISLISEDESKRGTMSTANGDLAYGNANPGTSSIEDKVLALAARQGLIRRKDVEELLAVGKSKASEILSLLVEQGKLHTEGSGRATRYSTTRR